MPHPQTTNATNFFLAVELNSFGNDLRFFRLFAVFSQKILICRSVPPSPLNVFGLKKKEEFSSLRLPFGHYRTFTDKKFKKLFAKNGFCLFPVGDERFWTLIPWGFPQCDIF